jgi:pyruvate dehydrogenase E2 component (dihydrolipoamide acetyltransferase)
LAEEFGIDLATLKGTGPDGRIVRRDIEAAMKGVRAPEAEGAPAPSAPTATPAGADVVQDVPLSRMRTTIARRMQQSKQQIPHYYLADEADMTEAFLMRDRINEILGDSGRVTVNDVVLLATARALVKHPRFNAHWVDPSAGSGEGHLQLHRQINLGIAVALDDGLVAPAILDCANKGLEALSREARDLTERARRGSLSPEEYSAANFTISNIGPFNIGLLVPIINPPQVGILGVGTAREKPVVRDSDVVIRQMMSIILAGDHRATDGAEGARFLGTLRDYLETPGLMLL